METKKRYSIKELSALTDISLRTIRFYIQEGLVDKPLGQAKGAYYTDRHLQQLLTIRKYKEAGVSLERIAQILGEESSAPVDYRIRPGRIRVLSRIDLMEGVELTIDPELSGLSQSDIRRLVREILESMEKIRKEKNDDE